MMEFIRYICEDLNPLIWIIGLMTTSATYFAGRLVSLLLAEKSSPDGNIALGALLISALSAVFFTGVKTVLLPVVLIFLLFLVIHRSRLRNISLINESKVWKENAILWTYFSIVFLLQFIINHRNSGEWAVGYPDNYVYITQINQLFSMRTEASSFELEKLNFGQVVFPQLYHYFEFWPAVLFRFLTGKLSYFIFTLFLIPWLASIVLFQSNRILVSRYKTKRISGLLVPLLVFTTLRYIVVDDHLFSLLRNSGITSGYFKFVFFQNYGYWHFFSYKFGVKLLVSAVFLTPLVFFYFSGNTRGRMMYSAVLPFASILYLPFALLSGLHCLIWEKRNEHRHSYLLMLLPLAGIPMFYFLFGSGEPGPGIDFIRVASKRLVSLSENPFRVWFTIYTNIFNYFYWLFMPLMLTALVYLKNKWIRFFCLWFISYPLTGFQFSQLFKVHLFMGIVAVFQFLRTAEVWYYVRHIIAFVLIFLIFTLSDFLFSEIWDFFQIYALTILPMIYILSIFIWGSVLNKNKIQSYLFTFPAFAFLFFNFQAVIAENRKSFSPGKKDSAFYSELFGRLAPDKIIHSVYCTDFSLLPYFEYDRPGNDLMHYTDEFSTSVFSVDLFTKADTATAIEQGIFQQYSRIPLGIFFRQNRESGKTMDQLRLEFLRKNEVRFILRNKGYPRESLNFLNRNLVDSAFNRQLGYQVLKLQFD